MKTKQLVKLLSLALVFIFATSCGGDGDDIVDDYYFTAKIGGNTFNADAGPANPNNITGSAILDGDFNLDQLTVYGTFNGAFANVNVIWSNEDRWSESISLCNDFGSDCIRATYNPNFSDFLGPLYHSSAGTLTFSKYDTINNIAEGTINFTGVSTADDTDIIEITGGAFRLAIER